MIDITLMGATKNYCGISAKTELILCIVLKSMC